MNGCWFALAALLALTPIAARAICPYDVNCLDNPYSGRGASAPTFDAAPYGRRRPGAAFGANPLRGAGGYDPYASQSNFDLQATAPPPGDLGAGLSATPDAMQGLDPDRPK